MARLVVLVTSSTLVPQILEHLAKHGGEWKGIAALARELGANYPWTWQVLVQMERAGVIRIDRSRRPYVLRLSMEMDDEENHT